MMMPYEVQMQSRCSKQAVFCGSNNTVAQSPHPPGEDLVVAPCNSAGWAKPKRVSVQVCLKLALTLVN